MTSILVNATYAAAIEQLRAIDADPHVRTRSVFDAVAFVANLFGRDIKTVLFDAFIAEAA
jgi:hypothetical protein